MVGCQRHHRVPRLGRMFMARPHRRALAFLGARRFLLGWLTVGGVLSGVGSGPADRPRSSGEKVR
jgi:hypothetical protein